MKFTLLALTLVMLLLPASGAVAGEKSTDNPADALGPAGLASAFNPAARRSGARLGLADAPGVTWKMVSLAQGWNVQVPVYWSDYREYFFADGLESVFGCFETGEAVILKASGPEPVLLELLGTPDDARFKRLLPDYRRLVEAMLAEEGEEISGAEHRIAEFGVGGYGAWRVKYQASYPDMPPISKVLFIVPYAGGSHHLTVVTDARALDTSANLLASRLRINHGLYPGGVDALEMSEERCTTIVGAD